MGEYSTHTLTHEMEGGTNRKGNSRSWMLFFYYFPRGFPNIYLVYWWELCAQLGSEGLSFQLQIKSIKGDSTEYQLTADYPSNFSSGTTGVLLA